MFMESKDNNQRASHDCSSHEYSWDNTHKIFFSISILNEEMHYSNSAAISVGLKKKKKKKIIL